MRLSQSPEAPARTTGSSVAARWLSAILLVAACGFLVLRFLDSLWPPSIDIALHYALTARLSEHWNLPTDNDPSLEEMNVMPRYAHRLAALVGKTVGSPMAGLHLVALLSLAALWSSLALMFASLPRASRWVFLAILAALLAANRLVIHLELFGDELVGNYFYPQLVAQAAALALISLALWLDRAKLSPLAGYIILGASVPILQQFHLLPALEVLGLLTLLVALDGIQGIGEKRWMLPGLGVLIIVLSLGLTVSNSAFATVVRVSETHGVLNLKYTPTIPALALQSILVGLLSGLLVWRWLQMQQGDGRRATLALKYIGLFGISVAGLCILQILLLQGGYGSEYACRKYGFGLNTVLVLDLALLPILLITRLQRLLIPGGEASLRWPALAIQSLFPSLFVLLAFVIVFPSPSAKVIRLTEVVAAEKTITAYEQANPPASTAKYDYAIGLFPGFRIFDYLISIGTLKAPRVDNADDMLNGYPPSKPKKISRVFTRVGAPNWDLASCRQAVLHGDIAVVDGACVLQKMSEAGIVPIP